MQRATLRASTPRLEGVGIHSGRQSWVSIHPPSDVHSFGIRFKHVADNSSVAASPEIVVSSSRCTTIAVGERRLNTIEHLMSALFGCGVTDAIIEFDSDEVPILDGSAKPFVEAIECAGVVETTGEQASFAPGASIVEASGGSTLIAVPANKFGVTVVIEYLDRPEIGVQAAYFDGADYLSAIAPARTYGFLSELEALTAKGLATGASFDNCVALTDSGSVDTRTPLRFENELARHKLLDVIGDLALTGLSLKAHIVALRPSHTVNCNLARRLKAEFYEAHR